MLYRAMGVKPVVEPDILNVGNLRLNHARPDRLCTCPGRRHNISVQAVQVRQNAEADPWCPGRETVERQGRICEKRCDFAVPEASQGWCLLVVDARRGMVPRSAKVQVPA